jgi:hypothetical protein
MQSAGAATVHLTVTRDPRGCTIVGTEGDDVLGDGGRDGWRNALLALSVEYRW